jgi:hypothetical protein
MATLSQTTGRTIDDLFAEFDAANPDLYDRFVQIAFRLIDAGRKRYSSKTILCVMRYERDCVSVANTDYKINDAFTSRYARKFADEFPDHAEFFAMRELRSAKQATPGEAGE